MGIRLVMEATGHAPRELTWREKYALVVLAGSAMDATRECPAGIENKPDLVRRLGMSRTQRYAVLDALCEKGALVHLERGRNGVEAVYAIAAFPGTERPGDPDVPPADDPVKGPGNRDASGPVKGPGSVNEGSRFNPVKGPGNRDPSGPDTVLTGIKGFKTGGKPPPSPPGRRPLFPFALTDAPQEEGEHSEGGNPAPGDARQALAAAIREKRPEWSRRSILRALGKPAVTERPWPLVTAAMHLMAGDPATQHPGRLEHDGPWWAEAARTIRAAQSRAVAPDGGHPFDRDPESGLCRACGTPETNWHHPQGRTA